MKKSLLTTLCIPFIIGILALPITGTSETGTDINTETSEQKGLRISTEVTKRDDGFKDFMANMKMTLKNQHGQESTRYIRIKTLEVPGDGDKTMSIFDNPRDVKGTAMLSFTHKAGSDDQWLYLPALKRVKRISSSNKSGPFMGSEFAYEDISSQEVEKYTYNFIQDEIIEKEHYFVLERFPVDKNSGYSKQIVWIHKGHYRVHKIDFFDRKKSLLKTLKFNKYQLHIKKFWRSSEMVMINHQNKKSTILSWENFQFRTGLSAQNFTQNALKRAK